MDARTRALKTHRKRLRSSGLKRVEVTVPEESVGDVMGDLNSRRGRPLGMEARGNNQVVSAEVPMAEMLSYAPDLRAMTGGRGDYAMDFLRYEDVPQHVAQKVVEAVMATEQTLQSARFNKSKAAKVLGLTRQQLYGRLRKYGLE